VVGLKQVRGITANGLRDHEGATWMLINELGQVICLPADHGDLGDFLFNDYEELSFGQKKRLEFKGQGARKRA